ncbi:COMPASS component BRE2, partial [Phenoliferia sp. Uapishka_3]
MASALADENADTSDAESEHQLGHAIEERDDSPGAGAQVDTPERDDSEAERPRSTKRASATPRSPAIPHLDSNAAAHPPIFQPHTANLPESSFEFYSTRNHPINKINYRYTPCGPSTTPGLPLAIHRVIEGPPRNVRFSWEDRSSFVLVTEDGRSITAEKGWRAARANVPVREGNWYWEVKVDRGGGDGGRETGGVGEGSWARVGVARREAPLNAPVGFDGHSYSYRDRSGDAITLARPKPYGKPYGSGSTIGIYISLPPRPSPGDETDRRNPARIVRKRVPIRYKGQLYFESLEYPSSKEMEDLNADPANKAKLVVEEKKAAAPGTKSRPPVADLTPPPRPLPRLAQAKIAFFLDGVCQGVAYENIYDFLPLRLHPGQRKKEKDVRENWHDDGFMGYFPMASVFGGAIATLNPGPDFAFPPPVDIEAALKKSPHPPTTEPLVEPPRKNEDGSVDARPWRPLCDRYAESFAEQATLDDVDERESIRVFYETQKAEAAERAKDAKKGGLLGPSAAKRVRTSAAISGTKLLAELGAVKKEDVVSVGSPVGSPLASPRPSSPAPRPSGLSETVTMVDDSKSWQPSSVLRRRDEELVTDEGVVAAGAT